MMYDSFKNNRITVLGAAGTVTLRVCDSAATSVQTSLDVPEIHSLLLATDSHGYMSGSDVLDSHSRLQAILHKTGSKVKRRIWVVEGLFYRMAGGKFDKEVSGVDLEGSHRTGNQGLCELLIYKQYIKRQLFQREAPTRANDIRMHTDVPFTKWVDNEVEPRMKTFRAWLLDEDTRNITWRAGRTPSEVRWLASVEDAVFGSHGTLCSNCLRRPGLPADALNQGALAEELTAMGLQQKEEQVVAQSALVPGPPLAVDDRGVDRIDLALAFVDGPRPGRKSASTPCRASSAMSRKSLAANIVLISQDTLAGLSTKFAQGALGGLRGTVDLITPARSKYVAILFDVKCSGEATHRPSLRSPPLQRGDSVLKPLVEVARARLTPQLPGGEDAPDGALDVGDIRCLLDFVLSGNL